MTGDISSVLTKGLPCAYLSYWGIAKGILVTFCGIAPWFGRRSHTAHFSERIAPANHNAITRQRHCVRLPIVLEGKAELQKTTKFLEKSAQSVSFRQAPVAQLDRALPSEGRGHRFESCRVRQICGTSQKLGQNPRSLDDVCPAYSNNCALKSLK